MNAIELAKVLGEIGMKFYESQLQEMVRYFSLMLDNHRVIVINKDGSPYSVFFFSITDDPDHFLLKDTWDYRTHNQYGKIVYVEKLVSKGWDREIRVLFEGLIVDQYPQIEYGVWHRWGKTGDRKVTVKRRLSNVRSQIVE